jgi:hypothetical protein
MIKTHSDDPDIEHAANVAYEQIDTALKSLPKANSYDYGGHYLNIGEYDVCAYCATAIAEAQQAQHIIEEISNKSDDPTVKEHLDIAAELFRTEAEAAVIRAELHNGHGTEKILNTILRFNYDRNINDSYQHSHNQGK